VRAYEGGVEVQAKTLSATTGGVLAILRNSWSGQVYYSLIEENNANVSRERFCESEVSCGETKMR